MFFASNTTDIVLRTYRVSSGRSSISEIGRGVPDPEGGQSYPIHYCIMSEKPKTIKN